MEKEEKDQPDKPADASTKAKKKTRKSPAAAASSALPSEPQIKNVPAASSPGKKNTLYRVKFFYEWCKSCGICSALCPKSVILLDEQGRPYLDLEDDCIGCRNCEIHCPDFAITIQERNPERRKSNGTK